MNEGLCYYKFNVLTCSIPYLLGGDVDSAVNQLLASPPQASVLEFNNVEDKVLEVTEELVELSDLGGISFQQANQILTIEARGDMNMAKDIILRSIGVEGSGTVAVASSSLT